MEINSQSGFNLMLIMANSIAKLMDPLQIIDCMQCLWAKGVGCGLNAFAAAS